MLPDWLPSVHPLIVHFPIALLYTAVLFDVASLLKRDSEVLASLPVPLYCLGSVSAVVAYFTGRRAADLADIPLNAVSVVNEHSDLALYTMIFFGVYALVRIFAMFRVPRQGIGVRALFLIVAAFGLLLLTSTADHGGQLVFRYGLGQEMVSESTTPEPTVLSPDEIAQISVSEGGSWSWVPGAGALQVIESDFEFVRGALNDLIVEDSGSGTVLSLNESEVLLVTESLGNGLEMLGKVNVDQFRGEFLLVHNVVENGDFDYFGLDNRTVVHGKSRSDERSNYATAETDLTGSIELKSVSVGTHYRGYLNNDLVTHGHGPAAPVGRSGILLRGTGSVVLSSIILSIAE